MTERENIMLRYGQSEREKDALVFERQTLEKQLDWERKHNESISRQVNDLELEKETLL